MTVLNRKRCTQSVATIAALAMLAPVSWASSQKEADTAIAQEQARIAFAATNGIQNWQAVDRDTLLIEARGRKWYRAELMGGCPGLQHAMAIGFDYAPDGSFDRFSAVIVDGLRCPLKSLTETESPRAKKDKEAAEG